MNQAFVDTTIKFVEIGSHLVKKAMDEISVHRQAQKRAADLRTPLLDYMIQKGVINANQKEAAAAMLGSHAETLQLLRAATDKIAEFEAAERARPAGLGEGVEVKEAGLAEALPIGADGSYDSVNDPIVGRRTSEKKASDYALARGAA